MIKISKVSKSYGTNKVLNDCSVAVAKGEVVVVCGPSGSGKSTLIKCVNGLEPVQSGSIIFNNQDIAAANVDIVKIRSQIGMVFQHFELYPHMNVERNICLAQEKVLARSPAAAAEKSRLLLAQVGLCGYEKRYPAELSGGQQQRVAIARALAMEPMAMLFDEPTSALDPEMINEVLDTMVELAEKGMTMMVVTHEMGFARKVAHRVVFMDEGKIVEDAKTEEFFSAPKSERARQFLSKILSH